MIRQFPSAPWPLFLRTVTPCRRAAGGRVSPAVDVKAAPPRLDCYAGASADHFLGIGR